MQQRPPRTRWGRPLNPQTLPHCSHRFTKPRLAMGFCTQSQGQTSIWPGAKLEPYETGPIQVGDRLSGFLHLSSPPALVIPLSETFQVHPGGCWSSSLIPMLTKMKKDSSELGDVQSKSTAHPAAQALFPPRWLVRHLIKTTFKNSQRWTVSRWGFKDCAKNKPK